MKLYLTLSSALFMALIRVSVLPLPATAVSSIEADIHPLAVVGADTLTTDDLDSEISAMLAGAKGRELPSFDPDAVLERLVQNRLLEQEGYRTGADQLPIVRNQVGEFVRLKSIRALLDSVSASRSGPVLESADSLLGKAGMLKRYSHILVKDEALAIALRDSLSKGAAFADLAKRHSVDGTAAQGGDLGWAAEGVYVDAFEAAAARLSLNETTGPVQTQFGWHLITLTGSKADTLKSKAMAQALVEAREKERRTAVVDRYVDSLKTSLGVTIADSLLASLDYQSKDPAVQKELETSGAVLAVLPTGNLTVRGLTRNIRFQYYHGIADRPDAAQIRDRMFRDWVIEGLLSFQAKKLGLDREPDLLAKARNEERRLIREEVLKTVLGGEFKPSEKEIAAYYEAHLNDFLTTPRVKVQSVLARDAETARRFRDEMDAGAQLKWLASRAPSKVDSIPPFSTDWVGIDVIGLKGTPPAEGAAVGPIELPGGWAVARVIAVERSAPAALATCRDAVLRAMRGARNRQLIHDAFARLESATEIRIVDGAKQLTADRLLRLHASPSEGGDK
jgi:peptidyl-prolyl cis-trans isomerase C